MEGSTALRPEADGADLVDIIGRSVLELLHDGHREMRDAVNGLGADALDWRPTTTGNSIAVLVAHTLDAERFLLRTALDRTFERDREAVFRIHGQSPDQLVGLIDSTTLELDSLVAEITTADLGRIVARRQTRLGAGWLLRAPEHSREHIGQVFLTRDLWLERSPRAEPDRAPTADL